jgi:hypothetical protein
MFGIYEALGNWDILDVEKTFSDQVRLLIKVLIKLVCSFLKTVQLHSTLNMLINIVTL